MKLASYESAQSIMKEDLSLWHAFDKGLKAIQKDKCCWPSIINFTTHMPPMEGYNGDKSWEFIYDPETKC
jgi:hypothetical protein